MVAENFCIVVQKYVLRQCSSPKLVFNSFLMFHQISGSCSYRIALIKRVYSKVLCGQGVLICMAYLFRSTTGEIVNLWIFLLQNARLCWKKVFYFTRRQECPTFLRSILYSMPTISLYGVSAIYLLGVSLWDYHNEKL